MHILLATGGSPHSEAALYLGSYILSNEALAQIPTVVTVIKSKADCPQAGKVLARACDILLAAGIEVVRTKTRIGDPTNELIREIQENNYDLVIVGDRSSHRLKTRFLGSTATSIVEKVDCPVIIAKGKIAPLRRILLCDSGISPSILSRLPRDMVSLLAESKEVTVLHVMSQMSAGPMVTGKQLRADAQTLMQIRAPEGQFLLKDTETLEHLNIVPNLKVRHGLVVDEILKEARSGDHDLIVIGHYRGEGWGRLLLENLAYQIILRSDRPVLIV